MIARFRRLWSGPRVGAGTARIMLDCRDRVRERIEDVTSITSREVLAVGGQINEILEEAKAYVDEIHGTLGALTDSGDGQSLIPMLAAQSRSLSSYVDEVGVSIQAQSDAAREAMDQVAKIVDLGHSIEDLAAETKVLALNANIEATRLGTSGRAMSVIASEMTRLNGRIEVTNTLVTSLARSLADVLPRIGQLAASMQVRSEAFSETLERQLNDVAKGTEALVSAVDRALTSGDARLATILDKSYQALSHLQFEDPVAQDLRLIENDLVSALMEVGVDTDTEGSASYSAGRSRQRPGSRSSPSRIQRASAAPTARGTGGGAGAGEGGKSRRLSARTEFDSTTHFEGGDDRNHLKGLQGEVLDLGGEDDIEAGDVMLF